MLSGILIIAGGNTNGYTPSGRNLTIPNKTVRELNFDPEILHLGIYPEDESLT